MGIVHYLSGLNVSAFTQTQGDKSPGRLWLQLPPKLKGETSPSLLSFRLRVFITHKLAHMLNSLVRVTRRAIKNDLPGISS